MSAVTAAAAPPAARGTGPLTEREILTRIARGGLLICETELRYQLQRRGIDLDALPDLLTDLQQRGLIEAETHYRLAPAGAALVPPADRPAPHAISGIPWSTPPTPARGRPRSARQPPTATTPATPTPRKRASRPTPTRTVAIADSTEHALANVNSGPSKGGGEGGGSLNDPSPSTRAA